MKKDKEWNYYEKFEDCEKSEYGHLIHGMVYPTLDIGPHNRAYCARCGNILETYDGIHYLWLHRINEEILLHFEMDFT